MAQEQVIIQKRDAPVSQGECRGSESTMDLRRGGQRTRGPRRRPRQRPVASSTAAGDGSRQRPVASPTAAAPAASSGLVHGLVHGSAPRPRPRRRPRKASRGLRYGDGPGGVPWPRPRRPRGIPAASANRGGPGGVALACLRACPRGPPVLPVLPPRPRDGVRISPGVRLPRPDVSARPPASSTPPRPGAVASPRPRPRASAPRPLPSGRISTPASRPPLVQTLRTNARAAARRRLTFVRLEP